MCFAALLISLFCLESIFNCGPRVHLSLDNVLSFLMYTGSVWVGKLQLLSLSSEMSGGVASVNVRLGWTIGLYDCAGTQQKCSDGSFVDVLIVT